MELTGSAPIFHEGSKGYSCCKRRVLEFEEYSYRDTELIVGS